MVSSYLNIMFVISDLPIHLYYITGSLFNRPRVRGWHFRFGTWRRVYSHSKKRFIKKKNLTYILFIDPLTSLIQSRISGKSFNSRCHFLRFVGKLFFSNRGDSFGHWCFYTCIYYGKVLWYYKINGK